jgi:phosphate acetyltransferase
MSLIERLREKASLAGKTIVLPETDDVRTLKAAFYLAENAICNVILIGKETAIKEKMAAASLSISERIECREYKNDKHAFELSEALHKKRAHKGLSQEQARSILETQPLFYAAALVDRGYADGCVAGAVNTTGDVLRAAIQAIGLKKGSKIVSSIFLFEGKDGAVFSFGDCAVVPYPDAEQLATIAIDSAETHASITGEKPVTAMLSFSTKGSAAHEKVDLVTGALALVKQQRPDLNIDGELQFDAAYVEEIGRKKAPESTVSGKANVFIFPNIDAGNISYKITERIGEASAIGPIIQGLNKPMNDLSRGCNWQDIVNTACVTALTSIKTGSDENTQN